MCKSTLHTIYKELKNEIAVSSFEDKRYVIPGKVQTLAWGQKLISETDKTNKSFDLFITIRIDMMDTDEGITENDEDFCIENLDFSLFD